MDLQTIKQYFGNEMVIFNRLTSIEDRLTANEKKILYEIGLPNHGGYGGRYIMLPNLAVENDRYLKFATRKSDEKDYFQYLDLETQKIVFKFYSDEYIEINSSLAAYLSYVYIYARFFKEVRLEEQFGRYEINHAKYSEELRRRFLEYNDDVLTTVWMGLIEEMGYGVI